MVNETILSIKVTEMKNCKECLLEVYLDSHFNCTLNKCFKILASVYQTDESTHITMIKISNHKINCFMNNVLAVKKQGSRTNNTRNTL